MTYQIEIVKSEQHCYSCGINIYNCKVLKTNNGIYEIFFCHKCSKEVLDEKERKIKTLRSGIFGNRKKRKLKKTKKSISKYEMINK